MFPLNKRDTLQHLDTCTTGISRVTFLYQRSRSKTTSSHGYSRCRCNGTNVVDANKALTSTVDDDCATKLISFLRQNAEVLEEASNFVSGNKHATLHNDSTTTNHERHGIQGSYTTLNMGMIIDHDDNNGDSSMMAQLTTRIDAIRCTLPLDSKRPTVNRRFYHDKETTNGRSSTKIVHEIENIVYQALMNDTSSEKLAGDKQIPTTDAVSPVCDDPHLSTLLTKNVEWYVYCNRYLRILEYDTIGGGLSPHTDGIKICDVTQMASTHTLLLYLSDCREGGETVIIDPNSSEWSKHGDVIVPPHCIYQPNKCCSCTNRNAMLDVTQPQQEHCDDDDGVAMTNTTTGTGNIIRLGISPKRGRIVLFPHQWPHAGAIVQSIPKIMLRAEVTILFK